VANEPNEVTFHNVTGTGSLQWLAFHYKVNNPEGEKETIGIGDVSLSLEQRLTNHP
jgi:hypothetical protein